MIYTLGMMFSPDKERVLLIKKDRPLFQANLLNGIGGKYELEKDGVGNLKDTQVREFEEETGIKTEQTDWTLFATIENVENNIPERLGEKFRIMCYKAFSDKIDQAKQVESELPIIMSVRGLPNQTIAPLMKNVNWLVPMALNTENEVLEIKFN